jgi:hypothetical protein
MSCGGGKRNSWLEMKKAPVDRRLDVIFNKSEYSTAGRKVKGVQAYFFGQMEAEG